MEDFYFLSRPRRFGKSLLVDTLRELLEGNETLFRGLDIHDRWDWSIRYPVVRLSFDGEDNRDAAVRQVIEQPRERGYADKYRDRNEPIHLIGVAFGRDRSPAVVKAVPG